MSWKTIKLSEIAEEYRETYEPNAEEHKLYVGLEHIEQQTLRLSGIGDSASTQSTKRKFVSGDILFGSLRPYFRKVVKPNFEGVCSTDITVIRKKGETSQSFLKYLISNQPFIDYATNYSNGTRMPRANWNVIKNSTWSIPLPEIQRKIASILSTYDNLIENNTRRIKILEEMAQSIYKEWFVNFRFPGHEKVKFVDSPLGKIPEGWEWNSLGDIANITMGQSPKSEFYNTNMEGLPFHQGVGGFGFRFPTNTTYCTVEKRLANNNDILFSVRAPVGRINMASEKMIIGRGLASIQHKKKIQSFLFYQLKHIFAKEDIIGSGAIFNSVTKSDMHNIKIVVPNNSFDNQYHAVIEPIDLTIKNLIYKNNNLRKTRDLLLPELMSGELEV